MPFLAPVLGALGGSAFITQLLVGTALTVAGTLLSQAMAPKPPEQRDPGVSLTMQIGGNSPLSFLVGTAATAGHRTYAGSWGQDGQTPNAYFVDVRELANVPVTSLSGVYVEGERGDVLWFEPHAEFGYPISQGRRDGVDHLWVKFYDGNQTVADPYLRSRFGGHPDRPYDADMIGYGTPYCVVTQRYHRELWQGRTPALLFEVNGMKLYDIRKDSAAGGSGLHRRNNPSTWEFTRNPYVIAYHAAFMGIYVGTEWVWGLQNLPSSRLPVSAWIAAMNEADRVLTGQWAGTQFTIGGEITVDMQPADFLDQVAKSSLGRFIETAGSYKPRCGLPGAAVWSFTEAQLSISDPKTFTPFPGLESTHNTIRPTYTEPAEAWKTKPAPDATDAAMIASDGNRELVAGLAFPLVTDNPQAQRLAYSYLQDGRRFRILQATFHPLSWLLEPGDVIDGTLLDEGFAGKSFEILEMSGRRTFVQTLTLREVDPADFDAPDSAYQEWSVGPIQTVYPAPQPATGISFAPYVFTDNQGRNRRPAIEGFYQGGMEDIEYFAVQVRRPGDTLPFFEGEFPYQDDVFAVASQPIFSNSFVPNMDLEIRGKYVPYSARTTSWTSWLTVTTPDVRLIAGLDFDPYEGGPSLDDLNEDLKGLLGFMGHDLRNVVEDTQALAVRVGEQDLANRQTFQKQGALYSRKIFVLENQLVARIEELRVEIEDVVNTAIDVLRVDVDTLEGVVTAQGEAITALDVLVGNNSANGYFRANVVATEAGAQATIGLSTSATADGATATAALFLSAIGGGLSRVTVVADQFVVRSPAGLSNPLVYDGTALRLNVANIGTVNAGILQGPAVLINLNTGFFSFG